MKRPAPQPFSELQQYLHTHHSDMGHATSSTGWFSWPLPRAVLEAILPLGFRLVRGKRSKE